jgi:DNA processing protein
MSDERLYWLGFGLAPGIGAGRLRQLLAVFGTPQAAWTATDQALRAAGLPRDALTSLLRARQELDLQLELDRISARGFRLLTWDDDDYPARLKEIDYPPPVLYAWGALEPADSLSVAVVGTRRPSSYGRGGTRTVVTALASSGVTVVSGLARGIDGIAHRTALDLGGRTIAVLGSGLDEIYPPEHRKMAEAISESGAVLTDCPMGTRPEGGNFPPRNRIISGVALAVVVVEAGESSGALIKADFAADQGRDVFAVPGRIHDRASRGTNRLIATGAFPLTSTESLLEALNLEVVTRQDAAARLLPANATERGILESLGEEPLHIDEISRRSGMSIADISASLAMLELRGQVRQVGGMTYVLARETSPNYRVD